MQKLFSIAGSDSEWLDRASEAVLNVLGPSRADCWSVVWELRNGAVVATSAKWSSERARRMALHFPETTTPDLAERMRSSGGLTTVSAAGLWTEASRDLFQEMRCGDAVAASSAGLRGGLVFGRLLSKRAPQAPGNRRALAPIMRSVSLSWLARRSLLRAPPTDIAEAILSPLGKVVHASGLASTPGALEALRAAVAVRERERRRGSKKISGAAIWSQLVSGRWSLIDDYQDAGQRYILAVRNDAIADAFSLTATEARAIELTVLGRSPKQLVDDLGFSLSRVYALRDTALKKLSARSLADVVALARELPGKFFSRISLGEEALIALRAPAAVRDLSVLSVAERDVARDLLQAVPPREIARRRGRSLQTVANQVSSIYRKCRVSDRNEFVAFVRVGRLGE